MRASSAPSVGRSRTSRFAARVASGPDFEDLADDALDGRVERRPSTSCDEPDPQRRLRVEALAGEEEATRRAGADLREHERRDDRGDDPEPHLGEAERRVGRGDDDVRARDEAGAAAERVAVHARDERRRARVDRVHHPVEAQRVLDVLLEAEVDRRALPLDVGAGAEARPVAGEHDDARVADVGERLVQLRDQRRVERVSPLRLRERDRAGRRRRARSGARSSRLQLKVRRDGQDVRSRADAAPRRRRRRSTRTRSRRTSTSCIAAASTASSRSGRPARGSCSSPTSGCAWRSSSSTARSR